MHGPGIAIPTLLEFGYVPLNPTQNGRVGYGDAALGHHLDEISIAEPIREVPAHAQLYDFGLESTTQIDGVSSNGFGRWASSEKAQSQAVPLMHQNPDIPTLWVRCQRIRPDIPGQ